MSLLLYSRVGTSTLSSSNAPSDSHGISNSSRKLHQLLSHNGGHSKSGKEKAVTVPVNAAEALRLLPATWNLGGASSTNSAIGAPASASTSSNEVHKLALRIEGLLKDAETCGEGLQLVCVLLEALPWHVVAADYAANWLTSALPRIQQPGVLGDVIAVCDILLGVPARSQPEYWRQIGAPNATKYGLALIVPFLFWVKRRSSL